MSVIPIVVLLTLLSGPSDETDSERLARARRLAREFMIADTHIDVPYRLWNKMEDISVATDGGEFDYPRAKEGGLDAVFMSIFTPWGREAEGGSKALAVSLLATKHLFMRIRNIHARKLVPGVYLCRFS